MCIDIAALAPSPLAGSNEPWIAYGLVLDIDLDGVADLRLGMDNMPPPGSAQVLGSNPNWWRWDLHTGQSQSGHCDCVVLGGLGDQVSAHIWDVEHRIPGRFYAWASVIQGGRVVATDYAPDTGWLGTDPEATP